MFVPMVVWVAWSSKVLCCVGLLDILAEVSFPGEISFFDLIFQCQIVYASAFSVSLHRMHWHAVVVFWMIVLTSIL